uniref:Uncharacterized protein n=1 Tax=Amphimedon queenslandica TaxID=400682 RepID=A0A1X7TCX6_AMPQE
MEVGLRPRFRFQSLSFNIYGTGCGWYFARMASKNYQPMEREEHSTVKVGDYLYMWGGYGYGVHYDVMEVYHLPTGAWDQKPTTGTPPPGTCGYSTIAIGKDIYYFGGQGVDGYQNSLHCFNVDSFKWRELSPSSSDHCPKMKAYCGMVSAHFDGEDYLLIIGGDGSSSINPSKQLDAQYSAGGR